jgi:hypothetical protein
MRFSLHDHGINEPRPNVVLPGGLDKSHRRGKSGASLAWAFYLAGLERMVVIRYLRSTPQTLEQIELRHRDAGQRQGYYSN